jgi:TonB family protein
MQLRSSSALCLALICTCGFSAPQEKPQNMTKVYRVGKDVTTPEPVPKDYSAVLVSTCDRTKPVKSDMKLVVDPTGFPQDVSVDQSTDPDVAQLLLQWMAAVKFKPALRDGNPIAAGISDRIEVGICYAKETDQVGNPITRLHLNSAPIHKISPWKDAPPEIQFFVSGNDSQSDTASKPAQNDAAVEYIAKGITPPIPVYTVDPHYSEEGRKKHIQGECMVQVIVDAQGIIQNARIVKPLGYGLDEMAIEAVKSYRLKPARKDGKPAPVYITIAINFRLR